MPTRLNRIYTRTGDDGTTGLGDGTRLPKYHLRIEVLGCIDELNSQIGLTAAFADGEIRSELAVLQNGLFELGAEFALPGARRISSQDVAAIEETLDAHNSSLPPLAEFLLPGGGSAAAQCHLARAVCRRVERRMVELDREERINPQALHYVNRLSDLLFVLARVLARRGDDDEVLWQPRETQ
jgi:cob(I)alamin adenosyltransferase